MSRHLRALLNLIPLPALGALGGLLLGCATRESDRADAAERARERAIGERDEARRVAADLQRDVLRASSDAEAAGAMLATLSAEVDRLYRVEADALADDDCNTFEREGALLVRDERDELRKRCDALTARAEGAFADALESRKALAAEKMAHTGARDAVASAEADRVNIRRQLVSTRERLAAETARADAAEQWRAAHQPALDGLAGREPAEVAPAAEKCANCLGKVFPVESPYWVYRDASCSADESRLLLCSSCGEDSSVHGDGVRERVAARAASCPARRHSPDPLAIACKGCGAPDGYGCTNRHPD
jgi:hypothetical protein